MQAVDFTEGLYSSNVDPDERHCRARKKDEETTAGCRASCTERECTPPSFANKHGDGRDSANDNETEKVFHDEYTVASRTNTGGGG
jgi:hypothetical protein